MSNFSILLVDDEAIILNAVGTDLRQEKYEVTTANGGQEALQLIAKQHFDLIVTDLVMTGVDGLDVLKEVKRLNDLTCVIILTGYGNVTTAIDALRLGADDYLLKPCDSDELIIRIERCLEKTKLARELVEQNEQLARSERHKALLLNSTAEGIYGLDLHGKTTFINPAAEKMLGYRAAEIIAKNNHALIHHTRKDGSAYPEEECQMLAAIVKDEKCLVTDEVMWRKNGTSFPVEYSSTPIHQDDEVVGAVVIFSDVTEKKSQLEQQRIQENHLRQLEKFQSLTAMASGIAHNFNNILMAVLGNQELALETMPAQQKERKFIEAAFKASQRAAKISTLMLQFVGQIPIEDRQIRVTELLPEILAILRPQIPSRIELVCEGDDDVVIKGDTGMFQQVIVNLVTNSLEALGEQEGTIRLHYGQKYYSEKELKLPHMQRELPPGEYVFIEVIDTGPGMSSTELARAFEPFFTTKFTGRGMGLAAILGIMRIHKGVISLSSLRGKGLTATVLFPAETPEAMLKKGRPAGTPVESSFSGMVLLVDDEPLLRNLGQELLKTIGFEVLVAADGAEALEIFAKNAKTIKLIVLDFAMPRLNGLETLKRIREMSKVEAIISTGYIVDQIADQFENIENVAFLQKPFTLSGLKTKIREILSPTISA
nr:response regulator [Desulfobulbaceae bacterium]